MKTLLLALALVSLAACSSAPTKKLYKNCESTELSHKVCPLDSLCYCEEIPQKDVGGAKR